MLVGEAFQVSDQARQKPVQMGLIADRKSAEHSFNLLLVSGQHILDQFASGRGETHELCPLVRRVAGSRDQPRSFEAIDSPGNAWRADQ